MFSARSFEYSLRPTWRAGFFLLALSAASLVVGGEAARLWVSEALWSSLTVPNLQRALAIDPLDPRIHRILGSHYCYLEEPNMTEGLMHLRRATELSPYGASYWYSLGSACDLINDVACGDQAFEKAVHLSPVVPKFHWGAANHYLVSDQTDKALAYFHRLLELEPSGYAWPTFRLCLRATRDPELIYQKVVLPTRDVKLRLNYVNFLSVEAENFDEAHRVWSDTLATPATFPLTAVEPYLERLVALGRGPDLAGAWKDLEKVGVVAPSDSSDPDNLIYNGDFEHPPVNSGRDWRFSNMPFMEVDYADPGAYHGSRSFRVDFTVGHNDDFVVIYQFAAVAPNQPYVLQAYVRSENITSDSGPRFQVVDPVCQTCVNTLSDATSGTTAWHPVRLKFVTGPKTQLVQIVVFRPRGRTFPTEITGSFWVDSVSLKAETSGPEENSLKPAH